MVWYLIVMIVKSTLRASLLKGDCGNAQMASCQDVAWWLSEPSCGRGLMGAHAYLLDRVLSHSSNIPCFKIK